MDGPYHGHEHGFGGFRTNGPANFGGPGVMQQFCGGYNYGGYNNSGAFYGPYNGPYNYNYGGFDANRPLGGVSFGNAFGTATYSQRNFGVTTLGMYNGGFSGGYYNSTYVAPGVWSTPIYNYAPSVFGYGTGVFSPNFPSGNYISNGYIGYVPSGLYNPWCDTGLPYAVGANSYIPGVAIAPTLLMLNANFHFQPMLNLQPVVPATSAYPMIDPRLIDMLAPAIDPNAVDPNAELAPIPMPPNPGNPLLIPNEPQLPVQPDREPILNEFNAVPREQRISSLAEKIQSLRYQSSGDDAFHKSDYATADVFYATAFKTAPDRRAPYLRMAMTRIALGDFPSATSYLKSGLAMESDASRPWFTAEELYGSKVAERSRTHGGPLWNWLAERPMSADRLLLAGTFQKLRGYNDTADQMLAMASHEGAEAALPSEVAHLAAADIGQRAISHDLTQLMEQAAAGNKSPAASTVHEASKGAVERSGGIFMRGNDNVPRKQESQIPPLVIPPYDSGLEVP